MVRITRVYTRGGDEGLTSLGDGSRVVKSNLRVEVCGTVEEANSVIGLVRLYSTQHEGGKLARIQNDLFDLGAELCLPQVKAGGLVVTEQQVRWLEQEIDILNGELEPLESFILPGGNMAAAYSHLARTTIRRAERLVVGLAQTELVQPPVLQYLNRLSDYLFVLGRCLNNRGRGDILWVPGAGS